MRRTARALFGVVATLLLPACSPREETQYYSTGEVKYKAPLNAQGLVEGNAKYFYKNGAVSAVLPCRNGLIEGLIKRYYPNGKLESTEFRKNGETFGQQTFYYPSGQLKNKATRYGNVYRETTRSYHPNGEVSQMIIYDGRGRRVDFGVWHPNGQVDTTYTRPFFITDRDTLSAGQDYAFEVVLGNRRSSAVNVKVLRPSTGIDSTKGLYSRSRFIIRRPTPGQHLVTAEVLNIWAHKGSDTLWYNSFKPVSKSFWVLPATNEK
jgi:antitoxin component YwqK of YwqJK toxin-antitoxin module